MEVVAAAPFTPFEHRLCLRMYTAFNVTCEHTLGAVFYTPRVLRSEIRILGRLIQATYTSSVLT